MTFDELKVMVLRIADTANSKMATIFKSEKSDLEKVQDGMNCHKDALQAIDNQVILYLKSENTRLTKTEEQIAILQRDNDKNNNGL